MRQETYDFDASSGALTVHRVKEEADDYRYFPEPVPSSRPPSSSRRCARRFPSRLLPGSGGSSRRSTSSGPQSSSPAGSTGCGTRRCRRAPTTVASANVIANTLVGRESPHQCPRPSSRSSWKPEIAFRARRSTRRSRSSGIQASADPYLAQEVSDADELGPVVDRILADNPGQVAAYRSGKEGLLGFFVGQVMKETQGKANPRVVNDLVREKLGA